jgi:4-hydroxythreonine-4-phosphate dehydrogenase
LAEAIQRAARRGRLAVCDAATEADLDAVVEATWGLPGVRYVGSGGLAGAIGRRQAMNQERAASTVVPVVWEMASQKANRLLVVVGSAEASARTQVAELVELGVPVVTWPTEKQADLIRGAAEQIFSLMAGRDAVAVVVPQTIIPGASQSVASALAQAVISSLALLDDGTTQVGLVLIGGHTGRTVLDALETDALTILGEVHSGAVLSRATDGRLVTTRPGSFGGPDSLCQIVAAMTTSRQIQVVP